MKQFWCVWLPQLIENVGPKSRLGFATGKVSKKNVKATPLWKNSAFKLWRDERSPNGTWPYFVMNLLDMSPHNYRQVSTIRHTLVDNKIVDHSDVVGASPVGAAPTTSSFSTKHLVSLDWAKTTARRDELGDLVRLLLEILRWYLVWPLWQREEHTHDVVCPPPIPHKGNTTWLVAIFCVVWNGKHMENGL